MISSLKRLLTMASVSLLALSFLATAGCGGDVEGNIASSDGTAGNAGGNTATAAGANAGGVTISTSAGSFVLTGVEVTPNMGGTSLTAVKLTLEPEDGKAATADRLLDAAEIKDGVLLRTADGKERDPVGTTQLGTTTDITFNLSQSSSTEDMVLIWPGNDPIGLDPLM